MAAYKGKGRVQQNMRRVTVQPTLIVGALASKTVEAVAAFVASDSEYLLMNFELTWSWDSFTANDGPLTVGVADGDYSDSEIEQAIEAVNGIVLGDRIAQEQANRLVRVIGTVSELRPTLNEGMPVKTKLNWKIPIGSQPKVFVYNQSGTILTTGSAMLAIGHALIKFI